MRLRIARVLLHGYFLELRSKSSKASLQTTVGRGSSTVALDQILREMYPEVREECRNFLQTHKRIGRRWSIVIGSLGFEILLICSTKLSSKMYEIKVSQIRRCAPIVDQLQKYHPLHVGQDPSSDQLYHDGVSSSLRSAEGHQPVCKVAHQWLQQY